MVRLSFGGRTVDTSLTMPEIVPKLHNITEHLNNLVKKHASAVDPFRKAQIETQIEEKFFALQDFTAKFGKAFLRRVGKNLFYVTQSISDMAKKNINSLLSKYQNPDHALENYRKQIESNMKLFMDGESEERAKVHYLRRFAKDLGKKSNSTIGSAVKTIKQSIKRLKKQQENLQAGKKEPIIKPQQGQAIPRR